MLLKRFRVTNFRSVHDSDWIDVDRVTAFIGVNESGKTNILLPLWKFSPAREGELQPTSDYPKRLFGAIREEPGNYKFISVEFDASDIATEVAKLSGAPNEKLKKVIVDRYFDGAYTVSFPDAVPARNLDVKEVQEILEQGKTTINGMEALKTEEARKPEMLAAIDQALGMIGAEKLNAEAINSLKESLIAKRPAEAPKSSVIAPRFGQIIDRLGEIEAELTRAEPGDQENVQKLVLNHLPKLVYYSNYGNLDSEIYLPHVVQNLERQDLGAKEAAKARTLRVLFKFVRLNPGEILELGRDFPTSEGRQPTADEIAAISEKKRERSILLQSAGTSLTSKFGEWWKQGDYRFRFEADGDHFRIWVADQRRPEEIELESRSTGLQWFLSFYLVFLVESEGAHQNAILLLDEPGLSLHPLAQRDLSAFFDGLAETNQIIYTTHSPFLVDADRLDRARKVYVAEDGTTKVTENLRDGAQEGTQQGAAYAVHSALNLTIAESLLLGCRPVIVEGPSDQHYLTTIKTLLIRAAKVMPQRELVFPPSGGAKTARMVASILTGRDDQLPLVLLDDDTIGRKLAAEMKTSLYQEAESNLLNVATFTAIDGSEIEDLIPQKFIADAIDRSYRVTEPEDEFINVVQAGKPIVPQIEAWATARKITLPKGWKVSLAKRIKQQLLSRGIGDVDETTQQKWVDLFQALEAAK